MSLVIYGPSKIGKTLWARSLGSHLYFAGLFSGREVMNGLATAEYAVFDDMQGGIKFFHGWKNWLGCQSNFQVKVMYKDPQLIEWGRPSIWVANRDPRDEMRDDVRFTQGDIDWLEANCTFICCDQWSEEEPIFSISHANTD